MSTIRAAGLGTLTASNTATIVDPATPVGGSATLSPLVASASLSLSGTYTDFTGIPSWAKRVVVVYNGASLSGSAHNLIQFGTASGIVNASYNSNSEYLYGGSASGSVNATNGFILLNNNASNILSGVYTFYLSTGNVWIGTGTQNWENAAYYAGFSAGKTPDLGSALTFVRMTASNGTDTYDSGVFRVFYE